jgi:hypothetical protein
LREEHARSVREHAQTLSEHAAEIERERANFAAGQQTAGWFLSHAFDYSPQHL